MLYRYYLSRLCNPSTNNSVMPFCWSYWLAFSMLSGPIRSLNLSYFLTISLPPTRLADDLKLILLLYSLWLWTKCIVSLDTSCYECWMAVIIYVLSVRNHNSYIQPFQVKCWCLFDNFTIIHHTVDLISVSDWIFYAGLLYESPQWNSLNVQLKSESLESQTRGIPQSS